VIDKRWENLGTTTRPSGAIRIGVRFRPDGGPVESVLRPMEDREVLWLACMIRRGRAPLGTGLAVKGAEATA